MSTPSIREGTVEGGSSWSLKDRLRLAREDVILDAAYALLARRGYGDASMDELAAELHMSKSTLYQLFPSKQDLAVGVVTRCMARHLAVLENSDPELPAVKRLERGLRISLKERARFDADCLSVPQCVIRDNPRYEHVKSKLKAVIAGLVDEAQAAGEIAPDIPRAAIFGLIATLYSASYDDVTAGGEDAADSLVDQLVSIVLRGLRPAAHQSPGETA